MRKRERRRKVLVPARMRIDQQWVDVRIRNMSSRGLLVETASAPKAGTYVEIRRATHVIVGRAVWRAGGQFGVRTQDRLDIDAIVTAVPQRPQAATAQGRPERRADPRRAAARIDARAERSRRIASALQFVSLAAAGLAAAAYAATKVYALLAAPAEAIAKQL